VNGKSVLGSLFLNLLVVSFPFIFSRVGRRGSGRDPLVIPVLPWQVIRGNNFKLLRPNFRVFLRPLLRRGEE